MENIKLAQCSSIVEHKKKNQRGEARWLRSGLLLLPQ